jgi:hypothetical protein
MKNVSKVMKMCVAAHIPFSIHILAILCFQGSFVRARNAYLRYRDSYKRKSGKKEWACWYAKASMLTSQPSYGFMSINDILNHEYSNLRISREIECGRLFVGLNIEAAPPIS